jgi:hypothetical protein
VQRHPSRKAGGDVVSYDLDAAAIGSSRTSGSGSGVIAGCSKVCRQEVAGVADAAVSRIITKNCSSVLPRAKSVKIIAQGAETDLMLPDAIIQTNLLLL